jgi:hypothetical protein
VTPKQLANVLIKLLGLSLCAHSVPTLIQIITSMIIEHRRYSPSMGSNWPSLNWTSLVYFVTPLAIGIWLIVYSQQITGWLFKKDEP